MLCDHLILCLCGFPWQGRKGETERSLHQEEEEEGGSRSLHKQLLFLLYYFNIVIINDWTSQHVFVNSACRRERLRCGWFIFFFFSSLIFFSSFFFYCLGASAADCCSLTALLWGNWKCFTGNFCHLAYNCNMVLLSIFNQYLTFSINNLSVLSQKEES